MAAARAGKRGTAPAAGGDGLAAWAARSGRPQAGGPVRGGLRFVFYGAGVDGGLAGPGDLAGAAAGAGSGAGPRARAGGGGVLRRGGEPDGGVGAAALVAQLADPGRDWDAIVVGEYERAFYGSQYAAMAPCSSTTASGC